jgi:hypothetical protein
MSVDYTYMEFSKFASFRNFAFLPGTEDPKIQQIRDIVFHAKLPKIIMDTSVDYVIF